MVLSFGTMLIPVLDMSDRCEGCFIVKLYVKKFKRAFRSIKASVTPVWLWNANAFNFTAGDSLQEKSLVLLRGQDFQKRTESVWSQCSNSCWKSSMNSLSTLCKSRPGGKTTICIAPIPWVIQNMYSWSISPHTCRLFYYLCQLLIAPLFPQKKKQNISTVTNGPPSEGQPIQQWTRP